MKNKKEIPVVSKSQFRRITAQGGNPILPCKECGGKMKHQTLPDYLAGGGEWKCTKCGREE